MAGEENAKDQGNVGTGVPAYSLPTYGLNRPGGSTLPAETGSGVLSIPQSADKLSLGPVGVTKAWETMPYAGSRFTRYFSQVNPEPAGLSMPLNLAFSPPPGYTAVIRGISVFCTIGFNGSYPGHLEHYIQWYATPLVDYTYLIRMIPTVNGVPLKSLPELPVFTPTVHTFIPLADTDVFDMALLTSSSLDAYQDVVNAYIMIEGEYLLSRGLPAQLEVSL